MVDGSSTMKDTAPDSNRRLAGRIRELRGARRLSLAGLADRSGVSRSMISLVERGESSPTAAVLAKLATALGVSMPALFEPPGAFADGAVPSKNAAPPSPLVRRADQVQWRDPASGYVRRNLTPPGLDQPMQLVEVRFPAGRRVGFENAGGSVRMHQQVWLLSGSLDITVGKRRHRLQPGDCLAMQLDQPTMFHNPAKTAARYAVVIAADPFRR
jgi:transcriptional regulator with XRE-family HTH domain